MEQQSEEMKKLHDHFVETEVKAVNVKCLLVQLVIGIVGKTVRSARSEKAKSLFLAVFDFYHQQKLIVNLVSHSPGFDRKIIFFLLEELRIDLNDTSHRWTDGW